MPSDRGSRSVAMVRAHSNQRLAYPESVGGFAIEACSTRSNSDSPHKDGQDQMLTLHCYLGGPNRMELFEYERGEFTGGPPRVANETHKGFMLWFTGPSGSGKTIISNLLIERPVSRNAKNRTP